MDKMPTDAVCQLAIVVKDIQQAISHYRAIFGGEAPEVIDSAPPEVAHTLYRGKPTPARAKLAFLLVKPHFNIELIEPDEHPSIWRELLEKNGPCMHHLAFNVQGMQAVVDFLEAKGIPLVQKGEYPGGRYAYLDGTEKLGALIELLEND